jgi:undecaprenyl-diphosphatase
MPAQPFKPGTSHLLANNIYQITTNRSRNNLIMNFFQAIILGIIQGVTEFLPISSSAHLVILPFLFGWHFPEEQIFPFNVLVQVGTLVAVIIYFWRDLLEIIQAVIKALIARQPFATLQARQGWYLVLATIPAGAAGLLLKDTIEAAFKSPQISAGFLFGTAALLVIAERIGKRNRDLTSIKWLDALFMGLAQILSLFPGISRSGATIAGGMSRHLDRKSAARFSFFMAVPVFLAAGVLGVVDLLAVPNLDSFLPVMATGFITAAIVGYFAIHWLLGFLARRSLYPFAIYCVAFALLTLIISYA